MHRRVKVKVLPTPTSLSTCNDPPCNSTSRWEMANPRPAPWRSAPRPTWWNLSKIVSSCSSSIRTGVTHSGAYLVSIATDTHVNTSAIRGEFHRIAHKVDEDLMHTIRVRPCCCLAVGVDREGDLLVRSQGLQTGDDILTDAGDIDIGGPQFQTPRFDTG